jgi:hypothetical protein
MAFPMKVVGSLRKAQRASVLTLENLAKHCNTYSMRFSCRRSVLPRSF